MRDYSLELPTSPDLTGEHNPLKVTVDSPLWAREMVAKLALYLKRERRYDFPPMEAEERAGDAGFIPYEAYLFHETAWDLAEEDKPIPTRAIGACGFRAIPTDGEPIWTMQWAWFHPYFRGRGHLSDFWPKLKATYGDFSVQQPLSSTMKAFLARHHSSPGT